MTDPESIPVTPASAVTSARLAAALASGDADEIGRALRHDIVVVPLLRGADGTAQIRVFQPEGGGTDLALFSSSTALAQFLADDGQREFDVRRGVELAPFLAQHQATLTRVVFDPAGPHPVAAPVDAVIDALRPRADDDDLAWIAGADRGAGEVVDFRLAMSLGAWERAVPADLLPARSRAAAQFVKRVRKAAPPARDLVAAWVSDTAREWAALPAAREVDLHVSGRGGDALVVLASRSWHVGRIDPDSAAGRALAAHGEGFARFDAGGAMPGVRGIHPLPAPGVPGGRGVMVDYWLPFPDAKGVCRVRFGSPQPERVADVLAVCEPVVANGAWAELRRDGAGVG